jgi:hypothetical protein
VIFTIERTHENGKNAWRPDFSGRMTPALLKEPLSLKEYTLICASLVITVNETLWWKK